MTVDLDTLHIAGVWRGLPEVVQQQIAATQSERAEARQAAWHALLAAGDVLVLALALDGVREAATQRMGTAAPVDRVELRRAATRVLDAPARACVDRFGAPLPAATHVVGLLTLALVPDAEDRGTLERVAPAPDGEVSLVHAWSWAAREVLALVRAEDADAVIARLAAMAVADGAEPRSRADATAALGAASSARARDHLYALVGAAHVEVRVEALAALAFESALRPGDYDAIRALLAGAATPALRVREADLREALAGEPARG